MNASDILEEAGRTFRVRNAVYKDNYKNIGPVMAGLFPDGVLLNGPDDFIRFHLLMLSLVKMTRYCNNWAEGGHQDSIRDAAVYNAMLESVDASIAASKAADPFK
jgi:hypothetical protein